MPLILRDTIMHCYTGFSLQCPHARGINLGSHPAPALRHGSSHSAPFQDGMGGARRCLHLPLFHGLLGPALWRRRRRCRCCQSRTRCQAAVQLHHRGSAEPSLKIQTTARTPTPSPVIFPRIHKGKLGPHVQLYLRDFWVCFHSHGVHLDWFIICTPNCRFSCDIRNYFEGSKQEWQGCSTQKRPWHPRALACPAWASWSSRSCLSLAATQCALNASRRQAASAWNAEGGIRKAEG